ncbi:hypothetical protein [uncultured Kordia sp.]|uniref:hypothetical protein n=1 Tax=uncultured Kordia sp. TaxID=507699 RepID=UPI002627D857|nr:hypothetical protein [uncultured Kordia sp.]
MKKRKMNVKKLTLQKRIISNMESVQGGIQQTQFIVICNTLINTTIIATTNTIVTGTNWPPIDPPVLITKGYVSCISDCNC